MKHTQLSFVIALALTAMACSKTKELSPEGTEVTITASFAENKTLIQEGSTQVLWEPGDEIKVFFEGNGGRFVSTSESASATSDFTGNLNFVFGINEGVGGSKSLWAVYPYRSDATSDGSSVSTTLPAEQAGKTGSFAKAMNISIAQSNSFNMGFYNVCGGVRFSVVKEGVTDVVFESIGGEPIAGKISVGFEGGVPVIQNITDSLSSITLTAPAGGTFETGKWYYIVALPGTLESGFKMTFNTEKQYAVLKSSSSVTVKRSVFGSLADADEGLIYKDKETPEPPVGDFIVFKDPIAKYACLEKFDTNQDGEISYEEAAAVTSIKGLFSDWSTVTSFDELKFFTGITNMDQAMKGLTSLKSVTIPTGVTTIENYAFDGCSALDSLTIAGTKVTTIGNYAFRSCSALSALIIPSTVTSIGQYAFSNCSSLSSIEIPSGVKQINGYCFQNCSALESIDLPSSIEIIDVYAFAGCGIKSISLPASLNYIGGYAFSNCKKLESIVIPDKVMQLGINVFNGCVSLVSAKLPSSMTSIPSGTFSGCVCLCQITFPNALTTIGESAFRYCSFFNKTTNVAKIEIPSTVTTIGDYALFNARNVLITSSTFVSIQANTFGKGTKIYVPDAKVEIYKVRTNWSNFANNIFPISSYSDEPFEMEMVDLGLSVKWANCNIGAFSPEEYGRYFAWGDVVGQTWNGSSWSGGGFSTYPTFQVDSNNNLKPEYDAAHVILGGSWRMPTNAEQQELINNCTCTWTSDYNSTGVAGRIFTSKKEGYTDKSIFLPAAGYGYFSCLGDAGSGGGYWSGTFSGDDGAWALYFDSDYVYTLSNYRSGGFSVRPVSE